MVAIATGRFAVVPGDPSVPAVRAGNAGAPRPPVGPSSLKQAAEEALLTFLPDTRLANARSRVHGGIQAVLTGAALDAAVLPATADRPLRLLDMTLTFHRPMTPSAPKWRAHCSQGGFSLPDNGRGRARR
ncbi:hypothetical protein Acsp04_60220 [Actinomadura sp. NBRC 104425]|uniref:hypothetical protein n=1 Tax=Actinomadura sp. NBRC 104425 TaxID=3032204 RepID=UPI0024A14842|nr:hypothetical protein [Actinomadura sp. NBRC 104425]GLZ15787.1 hypothetical protein Acsp04_60220 [Actinomadura sp. NBRC 104425]